MHEGASRRGRLFTVESIAGWIFADLLLVLFLVGLGSAKAYTPPPEPPKPKVEKKEKEPEPIVGMKTDPTSIQVRVNGQRLGSGRTLAANERQAVCRAVRSRLQPVEGERAALVLIFGGASDVSTGQNVARAIGKELACANARVFPDRVPTRAFWDGTLPLGTARLEVFLFVTEKQPQ